LKFQPGEKLPLGRFSRKELDRETGFYYFGARYLDPKTSVWISADPATWKEKAETQAPHSKINPVGSEYSHFDSYG
jgi:RHS repeat-associated protein